MRVLFIAIALLGFAALRADELQFDLTGTGFTLPDGNFTALGPAQIVFTVDSQSGDLITDVSGGTAVLLTSNMTVTGFNEILNGQSIFSAPKLTPNFDAIGNTDLTSGSRTARRPPRIRTLPRTGLRIAASTSSRLAPASMAHAADGIAPLCVNHRVEHRRGVARQP
ncbi:MAG TPA: hypothetical protein VGI91_09220 [Steroidobacteraceae bacterium]|jgi:hypothetical protein